MILAKSRGPKAHRTTVARSFVRTGMDPIQRRPPREKPMRDEASKRERMAWAKVYRLKPKRFFTHGIHLIMDNTTWEIPTTKRGAKFKKMTKARCSCEVFRAHGLSWCLVPGSLPPAHSQ
jgi:hypothetical protein